MPGYSKAVLDEVDRALSQDDEEEEERVHRATRRWCEDWEGAAGDLAAEVIGATETDPRVGHYTTTIHWALLAGLNMRLNANCRFLAQTGTAWGSWFYCVTGEDEEEQEGYRAFLSEALDRLNDWWELVRILLETPFVPAAPDEDPGGTGLCLELVRCSLCCKAIALTRSMDWERHDGEYDEAGIPLVLVLTVVNRTIGVLHAICARDDASLYLFEELLLPLSVVDEGSSETRLDSLLLADWDPLIRRIVDEPDLLSASTFCGWTTLENYFAGVCPFWRERAIRRTEPDLKPLLARLLHRRETGRPSLDVGPVFKAFALLDAAFVPGELVFRQVGFRGDPEAVTSLVTPHFDDYLEATSGEGRLAAEDRPVMFGLCSDWKLDPVTLGAVYLENEDLERAQALYLHRFPALRGGSDDSDVQRPEQGERITLYRGIEVASEARNYVEKMIRTFGMAWANRIGLWNEEADFGEQRERVPVLYSCGDYESAWGWARSGGFVVEFTESIDNVRIDWRDIRGALSCPTIDPALRRIFGGPFVDAWERTFAGCEEDNTGRRYMDLLSDPEVIRGFLGNRYFLATAGVAVRTCFASPDAVPPGRVGRIHRVEAAPTRAPVARIRWTGAGPDRRMVWENVNEFDPGSRQ